MVVALTLVLFFLVPGPLGLPSAVWLLLGLVALVVVIYMSLTDAETNARVLVDLYQERFDVRKLENRDLRKEVEEGLEYQRRIETQIRRQRPGVLRDRLEDTANQLTEWVGNIYNWRCAWTRTWPTICCAASAPSCRPTCRTCATSASAPRTPTCSASSTR